MTEAALAGATAGRGCIGICLSARALGSRERLFLEVASALAARGWQVDLLAAHPEPALREAVRSPLRLIDIGPRVLRGVGLPHVVRLALGVGAVARWIDSRRPALLFGTSIPPNLVSILAGRRSSHRVPIAIRQSNTLRIPGHARYGQVRRRWRDPWIPGLYREAAAVLAVAEEVADNLRMLGAAEPGRIRVIPNAVGVEQASSRAKESPHHPWFFERDRPIIVSVGRLVRKKDQRTLLEAFARVRAERPVRLVLFGEGPMRRALESWTAEMGLTADVALPGHTDNPFAYIARADLFVLSSVSEGMPSVLIEALACGTPIVSTDCPSGPREILAGGRFGELTPVGDVGALARAMLRQLDGPPASEVLVRRASDFSFARVIPRYVEWLEEVAGQAEAERPAPA